MVKYQRHSATSKAAAESVGGVLNAKQEEVLEFLQQCGSRGATDIEMQEALDMNPSTQRPRRIELVEYGLATSSGLTRLTPSGRKAEVWIAAGEIPESEQDEPEVPRAPVVRGPIKSAEVLIQEMGEGLMRRRRW